MAFSPIPEFPGVGLVSVSNSGDAPKQGTPTAAAAVKPQNFAAPTAPVTDNTLNVPNHGTGHGENKGGGGGDGSEALLDVHVSVQVRTGPMVVMARVVPAHKRWTCVQFFRTLFPAAQSLPVPRIAARTKNGSASLMEPTDTVQYAVTYPDCSRIEFDLPPNLGLGVIPPDVGPSSPVGSVIGIPPVGSRGQATLVVVQPNQTGLGGGGGGGGVDPMIPHLPQSGGTPFEQFKRLWSLPTGPGGDPRWFAALIIATISLLFIVVWFILVFSNFNVKSAQCAEYRDENDCFTDALCVWYVVICDARSYTLALLPCIVVV